MSVVERIRWKVVRLLISLLQYCPATSASAPDAVVIIFTFPGENDARLRLLAAPEFDVAVLPWNESLAPILQRGKYTSIQMIFMGLGDEEIDAINDALPIHARPGELLQIIQSVWILRERRETPSFWIFRYEIAPHGDIDPVDFLLAIARPRIRELVKYKIGLR